MYEERRKKMERVITYDLHHKDTSDYKDLYEVFKKLGGKQLTESSYVINTPKTQKEIVAMIKNVIYKDDIVYYISVDTNHNLFYSKI